MIDSDVVLFFLSEKFQNYCVFSLKMTCGHFSMVFAVIVDMR